MFIISTTTRKGGMPAVVMFLWVVSEGRVGGLWGLVTMGSKVIVSLPYNSWGHLTLILFKNYIQNFLSQIFWQTVAQEVEQVVH